MTSGQLLGVQDRAALSPGLLEGVYATHSQYERWRAEILLTGALGLIITLGGSWPCRFGVPGPPALGDPPPIALNRSGAAIVPWPGLSEPMEPDCGCKFGLDDRAFKIPPSLGGKGLFRESLSAVVEDEGVVMGDCAASLEDPACEGEDVPSLASLFLDLEDLFGSFARESCSCCMN